MVLSFVSVMRSNVVNAKTTGKKPRREVGYIKICPLTAISFHCTAFISISRKLFSQVRAFQMNITSFFLYLCCVN